MVGRLEMGIDEAIDRYIAIMQHVYSAGAEWHLGSPLSQQYVSEEMERALQELSMDVLQDPNARLPDLAGTCKR